MAWVVTYEAIDSAMAFGCGGAVSVSHELVRVNRILLSSFLLDALRNSSRTTAGELAMAPVGADKYDS